MSGQGDGSPAIPDLKGRRRVQIENVRPEVDEGMSPVKRVVGEEVEVRADIFSDGHDRLQAVLLHRKEGSTDWIQDPMRPLANDEWIGTFESSEEGTYHYTLRAWVDPFGTWQDDIGKKLRSGQDISVELLMGLEMIERTAKRVGGPAGKLLNAQKRSVEDLWKVDPGKAIEIALGRDLSLLMAGLEDPGIATTYRELRINVVRKKALYSTWYELFPRSVPGGKLSDVKALLPMIRDMGFDVLYMPPIHPIGRTNRKGKDNSSSAGPDDPGSPWAIGSETGGHKAVHPDLGTLDDFRDLVQAAQSHGIEIALDLAIQCSMDHPLIKERPQWFKWRPDGRIQYAENPPKKYEDIVPFDFQTSDWAALWAEIRSWIDFWVDQGVRIFRVDNPHTKPFTFWEWLIGGVKSAHPDVIFLSEAFTRPKIMRKLAKAGFDQSYTYFTWRHSKHELREYMTELTRSVSRDYFRPNFWPNTPDINPEYLQTGGRPAFIIRLVLAATMSSNYGIYGPPFELCVSEALPGREEYKSSEKYEIRHWNPDDPENIREIITIVNRIRRENPSLQTTWNIEFLETQNEFVLAYSKCSGEDMLIIVVTLDPFTPQEGWIESRIGLPEDEPYLVEDLLGGEKYVWRNGRNHLTLDPRVLPARIFKVRRKIKTENDFDYYS